MIELFFIVFYIKLRTFSYINFIYRSTENGVNIITKQKLRIRDSLPDGRTRRKKKVFFHLFPKILTIVISTSTWSQNEGKYLYFMGMKEFLPESDFVYGLRTVLCDASSEF